MSEVRTRLAGPDDLPFLATMLGEAAVWRPDRPTPTGDEVLADPRYRMYLEGWPRPGDLGVIAEDTGPVGAAWFRTFDATNHGHGFVSSAVSELAIAVVAGRRGEGIGRRLLVDLLELGVQRGLEAVSLSVSVENPARQLYESVGFVPFGETAAEGRTVTLWRNTRAVDPSPDRDT